MSQPGRVVAAVLTVLLPLSLYRHGTELGRDLGRAERAWTLRLWRRLRRGALWITRRGFEVAYRILSGLLLGAVLLALATSGEAMEAIVAR